MSVSECLGFKMIQVLGYLVILIALIECYKYRTIVNPISLMLLLWGGMIVFSTLNIYDVRSINPRTYQLITVGLICYVFGVKVGEHSNITILQRTRTIAARGTPSFRYKVLLILAVIALMFLLYQGINALRLIRQGYGLDYVRHLLFEYEENEMRSSSAVVRVQKFIVDPIVCLFTVLLPVSIIYRWKEILKHKVILLTICACYALNIISSGGRLLIIALGLYFFTCSRLKNMSYERYEVAWKDRLRIIIIPFLLAFLTFKITLLRGGENFDLVRHLYIYFGTPINFLDYNLELINNKYPNFESCGLSSFYGVLYPFFLLLRLIIGRYPPIINTIHELSVTNLQDSVFLGDGIRINAFATNMYQPYIDGRLVGIVVILFLFGFLSGITFHQAVKYNNLLYISLYLLFEYHIVFSMVRFWFTQVGQAVWLLLILITVRRVSYRYRI